MMPLNQPQPRDRGGESPPDVSVDDPGGLLKPPALAWLRTKAAAALAVLGGGGSVRVKVVADAEMAEAHQTYADEPGTTDVLTFDMSDWEGGEGLDTDIMVCADEGARQGTLRGHPVERELLLYIIHGVLHCLGHDDHDEAAAAAMHAEEDRVLEAVGVGTTYARPAREGGL